MSLRGLDKKAKVVLWLCFVGFVVIFAAWCFNGMNRFESSGHSIKRVTVYQQAGTDGDLNRWQIQIEGYGLAFMDTADADIESGNVYLVDLVLDDLIAQYEADEYEVLVEPWKVSHDGFFSGVQKTFHKVVAGYSSQN